MTKKYKTLELGDMTKSQEMIISIVMHEGELRERERIANVIYALQAEYLEDTETSGVHPVDVLKRVLDAIDLDYAVEYDNVN